MFSDPNIFVIYRDVFYYLLIYSLVIILFITYYLNLWLRYNFKSILSAAPAGGSRRIRVTATIPQNVTNSQLPVYSGYLVLDGSDSSSLTVLYYGVAGSMRKATAMINYPAYIYDDISGRAAEPGDLFTFPNPKTNSTDGTNYPYSLAYCALASRQIAVEVAPIINDKDQPSLGEIYESPHRWTEQLSSGVPRLSGRLKNGTYAPTGIYRFRMKALRVFGDESRAEDIEILESYHFNMTYHAYGIEFLE